MDDIDSLAASIPKVRQFVLSKTHSVDLANDLTQETMLRTWSRTQTDLLLNPTAYLITVAKSVLVDHWRTEKKYADNESFTDNIAHFYSMEGEYLLSEKTRLLAEVIDNMPRLRRRVFKMRRLDGKSRREIAIELEVSEESVKKHIQRAMYDISDYAARHDLGEI